MSVKVYTRSSQMLFAALRESSCGTKCECRLVRIIAAYEGTADVE
jgi:hypothetical protein